MKSIIVNLFFVLICFSTVSSAANNENNNDSGDSLTEKSTDVRDQDLAYIAKINNTDFIDLFTEDDLDKMIDILDFFSDSDSYLILLDKLFSLSEENKTYERRYVEACVHLITNWSHDSEIVREWLEVHFQQLAEIDAKSAFNAWMSAYGELSKYYKHVATNNTGKIYDSLVPMASMLDFGTTLLEIEVNGDFTKYNQCNVALKMAKALEFFAVAKLEFAPCERSAIVIRNNNQIEVRDEEYGFRDLIIFQNGMKVENIDEDETFIVNGFLTLMDFKPGKSSRPYNWKQLQKIFTSNCECIREAIREELSPNILKAIGIKS